MRLYYYLRKKVIGDLLEKTPDFYDKARILLTYDLSAILIILVSPIALFLFTVGLVINGTFALIAVLALIAVIFILKFTGNIKMAAITYTVFAFLVLVFSYAPQTNSYSATNELWFVVMFLYVYFTLGIRFAILSLLMAIGSNLFYINFLMFNNLHNEEIYESNKMIALNVTVPVAFYAIFHIVSQFMITQKHAELDLKKKNSELEKQNAIIEKQKDEKSAMIKEIHHRVKNNLQIVNSLLRLQSSGIKSKKILAMFEESQNRVLTMALLHENLYKTSDLGKIDVKEHFRLLANDLINSYATNKQIELDLHIENMKLGTKTMVPLGLIINEMITNSLKYAFVDRFKGKIIINLKHLTGKKYEMIIGDDGIGIENVTPDKSKQHLGTELIAIFTEQLDGTIQRMDMPGTVYRLEFESIDKELKS